MPHGDLIRVPIAKVPAGFVELYEDQCNERCTHDGRVDCHEWTVVCASASKLLGWLNSSRFANVSYGDPEIGFCPYSNKLDNLDSLSNGQSGTLEVTLVYHCGNDPDMYRFIDGRHRAFWLATHGAEFVPVMVPKHQQTHFNSILL